MPAIPAFIGQRIGSYRIEHLIGEGIASVAFGATHPHTRQAVTVTVILLPDALPHEACKRFMSRFRARSEALRALSHPHLLKVVDYGVHSDYPFLITEATVGLSVAALLKRYGRCSPETTYTLLTQIASALDYVHTQGITHGNLTPATLLLQPDGIQIVGLGMRDLLSARGILAISQPYPHLCNLWGNYLGDPHYLAPECIQGESVDSRNDIYALGMLLFELLLGSVPFRGRSFLEIAAQHSLPTYSGQGASVGLSSIDMVLSKALAHQPEQRYQTAREVVQAYEAVLRSMPAPGLFTQVDLARDYLSKSAKTTEFATVNSTWQNATQARLRNSLQERTPAQPDVQAHLSFTTLTKNERARIIVRDIESHIWDGYQLPEPQESLQGRIGHWLAPFIGGLLSE